MRKINNSRLAKIPKPYRAYCALVFKMVVIAIGVGVVPSEVFALSIEDTFRCPVKGRLSLVEGAKKLGAVQTEYEKVQAFSTRFVQQSFLAALEVSEESSGTVWFSRPGKMKWKYESPTSQVFLIRDETLWYFQEEEQQLLIDSFQTAFTSDVPATFLMGVGKLTEQFTLVSGCKGPEGILLELSPKNLNESGFVVFRLLVDSSANIPRGAQVVDRAGNRTSIALAKIEPRDALDPVVFSADFPKGIDIDDRRVVRRGEEEIS